MPEGAIVVAGESANAFGGSDFLIIQLNQQPVISNISWTSGKAQLRGSSFPGKTYEIQRSLDLLGWFKIFSDTAESDARFIFEDIASPTTGAFYRIVVP